MKKEKMTSSLEELKRSSEQLEATLSSKLQQALSAYEEYEKAKNAVSAIREKHKKLFANLYAAKYRREHPEKYILYGKKRTQEMQPGYLRTKLKQIGVSYREMEECPELLNIMREHLIAYRNRDSSWNRTKQRELLLSKIHKVLSKNSSYEKSNKKA
jgi:hypothetical protein